MIFNYRYVPYGTKFQTGVGIRTQTGRDDSLDSGTLYENELAADVGGVCLGYSNERLAVVDHHFHRSVGQFPSAAAAVLHKAHLIAERFIGKTENVWLVSHNEPDFDALTSLFLAKQIISGKLTSEGWSELGVHPDGWIPGNDSNQVIDWYQPAVGKIPVERRWAVQLASHAARVDNCKPSRCPRSRTLHAVLYATIKRRRSYLQNGACEFFEEVQRLLTEGLESHLDPFFDSVLDSSLLFVPELKLLDLDEIAYERDLQRAERKVVFLPKSARTFSEWFSKRQSTPLLNDSLEIRNEHLMQPEEQNIGVDGLFLRDPESLLFKEWARQDTVNSSMGNGFKFTAIAYSNGRSKGLINSSDYYFAIDPERSDGTHLYTIWARLQAAEIRERMNTPEFSEQGESTKESGTRENVARGGFEMRGSALKKYFDDPWFDGSNFGCTIVPTPNRGTVIGRAGRESDLSDDPVASIVRQELLKCIYERPVDLTEFCIQPFEKIQSSFVGLFAMNPPRLDSFRFVRIKLEEALDLHKGDLPNQIGEILWRQLVANGAEGLPVDFRERHLVVTSDSVAVWNRRGVAIAFRSSADSELMKMQDRFDKICNLTSAFSEILASIQERRDAEEVVELAERTMAELATVRHELAFPENLLLRRFFDSSRLDESLSTLREVNATIIEREELKRFTVLADRQTQIATATKDNVKALVRLQTKIEYVEIFLISVYAAELIHVLGISFNKDHATTGWCILGFAIFSAIVAAFGLWPWGKHVDENEHADNSDQRGRQFSMLVLVLVSLLLLSLLFFVWFVPTDSEHTSNEHAVTQPHSIKE
jgi:hypothetical protein